MKTRIGASQIKSYRKKGFIAIEGFLSPRELNTWRKVTVKAVEERLAKTRGWEGLNNQAKPDDFYAQVFVQCLKLADTSPAMRELIFDPRIGKLAADLAGVDGLRVWHDQALFKPPFGNPTGYHLDNPYWSFSSRD